MTIAFLFENCLEFGTSLGNGTIHLALGNKDSKITTVEACQNTYNYTTNEFKITSEVEQFFERNEIMAKISQNTPFKAFPKAQMQMDFVDHIYAL